LQATTKKNNVNTTDRVIDIDDIDGDEMLKPANKLAFAENNKAVHALILNRGDECKDGS